jgi:hypothetical protein
MAEFESERLAREAGYRLDRLERLRDKVTLLESQSDMLDEWQEQREQVRQATTACLPTTAKAHSQGYRQGRQPGA